MVSFDDIYFLPPLQAPFIPPFEYLNGTFNTNIRGSLQESVTPGPDDHGWVPNPFITGTTPVNPPYLYADTSDVPLHHGKTSDIYNASNPGLYTNVVLGTNGVPFMSSQGVQVIWEQFFSDYMNISGNDWQENSEYYHYVFGKYLQSFIFDFLEPLAITVNINQSDIDNVNFLNADSIDDPDLIGMQAVISNLEFTMPDYTYFISGGEGNANAQTILNGFNNVNEAASPGNPDGYPYDTPAAWFLGVGGSFSNNMFESGQGYLENAFALFAKSSDLQQRSRSTMNWAYNYLLKMLDELTLLAASQSNRVSVLSDAEEAATSDMAAIQFTDYSSSTQTTAVTANQRRQGYVQVYQAQKNLMNSYQTQQSTQTQNTNSAYNDSSNIVNDLLTTLNSLVSSIFKAG
jgi:hypothetical protein